jgi:hypothetical protein
LKKDDEINPLKKDDEINPLKKDDEINPLKKDDEINPLKKVDEINPLKKDDEINPLKKDDEINPLKKDDEINPLKKDDEINPLKKDDEINPLNAVINPRYKWPDNILYYSIQNGAYTIDQVEKIEEGIRDLQELAKLNGEWCIRIFPRETQPDFVYIQDYSGCSSYVGRIGGSQRMSLVDSCVQRHGTIMHEFLHALGFHHEQKRTDRDDFVEINWDNIQEGTENNFVKLDETQITLLNTTYDYGSVLHYSAYGFAIDPSIPTIIPHDPDAEIGQRVTLSPLDIERVQIHYDCLDPADSVYFKHLEFTLGPRK